MINRRSKGPDNICVYTGARVYFEDYGFTVAADLFKCGDQILIQWMPASQTYSDEGATHRVWVNGGYHHITRGVTVVPLDHITGEFR